MWLDPDFYEARAITFSKMGQHKQALEIYVFKLEDPQKAEESDLLQYNFFSLCLQDDDGCLLTLMS